MTANWAGAPATWVDGAVAASQMNTEIRDRFDWVHAALALVGIDSATTAGRVTGARFGCRLTASQGINDATDTIINWDAEDWDSGFWSLSPAPGKVTVPAGAGGLYLVICAGKYDADADGSRGLWLTKNGSGSYSRDNKASAGAAWDTTVKSIDLFDLSAGDYLQALTRHSANNNLNIEASIALLRVAK